jgi:hypothetical protein
MRVWATAEAMAKHEKESSRRAARQIADVASLYGDEPGETLGPRYRSDLGVVAAVPRRRRCRFAQVWGVPA